MRVLLLAPLLTACDPAHEGDDVVVSVDDAKPAPSEPPAGCDGPSAQLFFGADPDDVILSGDVVPAETGGNGGAHVTMGLAVSSPTSTVAWRIDLVDVDTEELVGSAASETPYVFTKLSSWSDQSCTGYLPDARVCLGDCQTASLACELDGRRLRAEAYATTVGGQTVADPQATVEFVLAGSCSF